MKKTRRILDSTVPLKPPRKRRGTLQIESGATKTLKDTISSLRVVFPLNATITDFINIIKNAKYVPGKPEYFRIEDMNGRFYRAYTVSNSCTDSQGTFFGDLPLAEMDTDRRVCLVSDKDRWYIFPENEKK